jgi:hypothetical protein
MRVAPVAAQSFPMHPDMLWGLRSNMELLLSRNGG